MIFPLLIGTGMLVGCLLSYGITIGLLLQLALRLIRKGYTGLVFWKNMSIMVLVSLLMGATHLIQIALWALALLLVGEVADFETAFYCSAQNYTALGYGDVVLSRQWRLLGPLEAVNGLLLFGLSTATIFALMSRLIANQLRFRLRDR
jgi:hypothetical protein